jgi:hypothetical protein
MSIDYHHRRSYPIDSDSMTRPITRRMSSTSPTTEEEELAKLGYKQEFKREFSWISTFSFAFSISGLLATVL